MKHITKSDFVLFSKRINGYWGACISCFEEEGEQKLLWLSLAKPRSKYFSVPTYAHMSRLQGMNSVS